MPRLPNFIIVLQKQFFDGAPRKGKPKGGMTSQKVFYRRKDDKIMGVFRYGKLTDKDGYGPVKIRRKK
tara:strand:- start:2797 stop:3000 length:204 start_codon:yes stop_codon:yes gene_type:complete